MSKKCPNCGYQESDESTVCHICGATLVDDNPSQDFNYDFGAQPVENQNANISFNDGSNVGVNNTFVNPNEVPMKIAPAKAAKLKKNLFSLSSSLIVICIIRFVFTFLSLEDVRDIQEYIPLFEGDMLYAPLTGFVSVYYIALVVLVLFLAASIVLMIFSQKVNKCQIPPQDNSLFDNSKKAFFAAIATTAVVAVYFILEICALVYDLQLTEMLDASLDLAETAGALVVDVLLVGGAITCLLSALKLSKSKQ